MSETLLRRFGMLKLRIFHGCCLMSNNLFFEKTTFRENVGSRYHSLNGSEIMNKSRCITETNIVKYYSAKHFINDF